MDYQRLITFIMEMVGTVAFWNFGSDGCSRPGNGYFGVIVLGVTTAVGGGAIRDVILGIAPPAMFQNPIYTLVATITSCVAFLILYLKKNFCRGITGKLYDKIMLVMDSIGLGIFTVVGVNTGISHGYVNYMFLLVFLGTITELEEVCFARYHGRSAAIYSGEAYLCLCINCWCDRLVVLYRNFWCSCFYGRSICSCDFNSISGDITGGIFRN